MRIIDKEFADCAKRKGKNNTVKTCEICGKKPIVGNSIARRGLSKKSGGIGKKTTGITRRRFFPNLQKVRAIQTSGSVKTLKVCTSCIQAGKVLKAPPRRLYLNKETAAATK